ncbi:hypothetical protein SRHO_G00064830 [Serrasalmus rhombeus]
MFKVPRQEESVVLDCPPALQDLRTLGLLACKAGGRRLSFTSGIRPEKRSRSAVQAKPTPTDEPRGIQLKVIWLFL